MRRSIAILAVVLSNMLLSLLLSAPVFAGGWAEVQADAASTTPPPVEGQPTVIGFTVLQHGVTPAGWVHPTVQLSDPVSGRRLEVAATPEGKDGHFVATVTLPVAGYWTWTVTFPELVVEASPVTIAVRTAAGEPPTIDPAALLTAVDQARANAVTDATAALGPELQRLGSLVEIQRLQVAQLRTDVGTLKAERDTLATQVAAARGGAAASNGLPVLGYVLIAVLAGASAGFVMAWLGGRSASVKDVAVGPSVERSTPA